MQNQKKILKELKKLIVRARIITSLSSPQQLMSKVLLISDWRNKWIKSGGSRYIKQYLGRKKVVWSLVYSFDIQPKSGNCENRKRSSSQNKFAGILLDKYCLKQLRKSVTDRISSCDLLRDSISKAICYYTHTT